MVRIIIGNRVGRQAALRNGCTAAIFDASRRLLLTRREDNGQWCLPGGQMEPGESAAECCVREVYEETGLETRVLRLIGVYSSPDMVVEYRDGGRYQFVGLCFECEVIGGQQRLSPETTAIGYFSRQEIAALDLLVHHTARIDDAFAAQVSACIR